MEQFNLVSKYQPCGDQPDAIESLTDGINDGFKTQVLLGVTGSGKTFTMANVIAKVNKPTLILAHNKILAAQLCSEFKEFFPENAVEYFVSYYDYYQPEAYIPNTDTFIEKDSAINDEIDKLRHSATLALSERRDVIIVSSVSETRKSSIKVENLARVSLAQFISSSSKGSTILAFSTAPSKYLWHIAIVRLTKLPKVFAKSELNLSIIVS